MGANQILEEKEHCRSKNKYLHDGPEGSLESKVYRQKYELLMFNLPHTWFQKIDRLEKIRKFNINILIHDLSLKVIFKIGGSTLESNANSHLGRVAP